MTSQLLKSSLHKVPRVDSYANTSGLLSIKITIYNFLKICGGVAWSWPEDFSLWDLHQLLLTHQPQHMSISQQETGEPRAWDHSLDHGLDQDHSLDHSDIVVILPCEHSIPSDLKAKQGRAWELSMGKSGSQVRGVWVDGAGGEDLCSRASVSLPQCSHGYSCNHQWSLFPCVKNFEWLCHMESAIQIRFPLPSLSNSPSVHQSH